MPDNLTTLPRRQQLPVAEIAAAIQALIELLNLAAGDPDLEYNGDDENDGTEADATWVEWDKMRGAQKPGPNIASEHEDDEDDDAGEDSDPAEDNADREAIDEREPDHEDEAETWAHWLDHPAELHIGQRPGHTTDQDVR